MAKENASLLVTETASATEDVVYMPLRNFADSYATKYGIELMAGFFHVNEKEKHFADTEENWHALMKEFAEKEVK